MLTLRFVIRQIRGSGKQAFIFVLCVALSLLVLVSLGSFSSSVRSSMLKDARSLHASDIKIHSHYPFSGAIRQSIKKIVEEGKGRGAQFTEFYSMARNGEQEKSVLSHLKVVERGYPFYGSVRLSSGRDFTETLRPGTIIVEQALLDRLHSALGDFIQIGSAALRIVDVVTAEPDRPVSFFSFGPRIFIAAADLDKLDLVKKGSRIQYNYLLQIYDPDMVDRYAGKLATRAVKGQERVKTFKTAESRVKRFFENFLFFLNLVGIFTLLLAGIGIQTALYALLRESDYTIAVMKSVGATSFAIISQFLIMIMILGCAGTILGLALSFLIQLAFPSLFAGILPANISLEIAWLNVLEGIVLGFIVVGLFSFLPLQGLKNIKPALMFRKEVEPAPKGLLQAGAIAVIICFLAVLAIWQLEDVKVGIIFVLALLSLIGITAICGSLLLALLKRKPPHSLVLRQALKGLFRPRNSTRAIIITLSSSLSVIFAIYLLEQNLRMTFIDTYPPDLPNAYFLDIQPSQKKGVADILGMESRFYPVVRARLVSINDTAVKRREKKRQRGDSLTREFNLTYRESLLDDERFLRGNRLFAGMEEGESQNNEVPVSVLDTVAEMGDIQLGDLLVFRIQGIDLQARVTSMRTRTASRVRPFFYFVFPEKVLQDFPQTIFSAVRLEGKELAGVQDRLTAEYPNISVIDIASTVEVLSKIMHKLSTIIQFFTLFSIAAGLLIIMSSIYATRLARVREAVYFKILGAGSSFVLQVFSCESFIIGLICSFLAAIISHVASWMICRHYFAIGYSVLSGATCVMIILTVFLVMVVGLGASWSILKEKPAVFLRDES
ncbi:MAG: ABC transporter permease [Desulfobulbaceae bacterium]|nr:ABC transporter permease [Desulfobulbaceae bacterium]